MAKDIPSEIGDGGLGDITGVLNNQSVSDLRWLDVDPEEYRKFEALPKQNLDIIPELMEFRSTDEDERVPSLIVQRPITVVNSNPLESPETPSRASVTENLKKKVASYVMMNLGSKDIEKRLTLEFSKGQLRAAASEIRSIIRERGLLGNVYINASHFPKCNMLSVEDKKFLSKYASKAKYLLSCDANCGCVCANKGYCSGFKKRVVSAVPYDRTTLASYVPGLKAEKRLHPDDFSQGIPSSPDQIKSILQRGFSRSAISNSPELPKTIQYQRPVAKPTISEKDIAEYQARHSAVKAELPPPHIVSILASLTKGRHNQALLASSDLNVRLAAKEHGIIGHTYVDIDVMGGPKATYAFIKKNGLKPDFLVSRIAHEPSDELVQLKNSYQIYASRPSLNIDNVKLALQRAVLQKRMDRNVAESSFRKVQLASSVDFEKIISQINLYSAPVKERVAEYSAPKLSIYSGNTSSDIRTSPTIIPEEVRRTISHVMNTGVCGANLRRVVASRYTKDDLDQIPEVGQALASVDGIQGFYHIDPTAYADYGKGCNIGSKTLRHNSVRNVLACSSCTGCKLQTAPGWCSKYAKQLVRTIPEPVRVQAHQRLSLPVVQDTRPIENPVEKYELASEMTLDLNGSKADNFEVSIQDSNPFE